ncbi:von Hippel-Lindau disease tumor suppressor [Protopterus annectens]|uniref:von Hippel-Lindau disease tumor suppressor n=1 Tax=Protopterus annectens TaxID=7888 RepID=UPI001CFB12FF|nr:von Hippel-Lindau disease tumor suppressor [Protopterus annectens]
MPEEEAAASSRPVLFCSQNSRTVSVVIFCNLSRRRVRPVWVDFKGEPQPYPVVEPDSGGSRMITYLTHPWLFRDADTDDRLLANQQQVFLPSPNVDGQPGYVNITLPVYSLKERCLQVIRKLVKSEDYRKLELVHSLYDDLENRPDVRKDIENISRFLAERIGYKKRMTDNHHD